MKKRIDAMIGQRVTIYASMETTVNHFLPAISIYGVLEIHPYKKSYRVVVDDRTYTYFELKNVKNISFNSAGNIIHINPFIII